MKFGSALVGMLAFFSASVWASAPLDDTNSPPEGALRQRRQIGDALNQVMQKMRRRINHLGHNIDRIILPKVQYAAEKIRDDVAPSIANTVLDVTNKMVISTAEGIQKSAAFLSNEVAPVIEDTMVEMSNAAVPVVNKGIDAVGTGLRAGVNVVSQTTSDGIKQFNEKVLGEQRHTRIKKIANNLSINFNNSINNLAGAIKKVTVDEDGNPYFNTSNDYSTYDTTINAGQYPSFPNLNSQQFFQPHLNPPLDRYQSKYHNYYNGYTQNPDGNFHASTKNMSIPQAFGKMMSNTAYSISKQILGPNLTEAVAPIARSVSSVIGQSIPSMSIGNDVRQASPEEKLRTCTTPHGRRGFCQDLSDCPDLVLELSTLRRSICFKRVFSPGVCCPDVGQLHKIRDAQRVKAQKLAEAQKVALSQAQSVRPQTPGVQNQFVGPLQIPLQTQLQSPYAQYTQGVPQNLYQQQLLNHQQQLINQQVLLQQQGYQQTHGANSLQSPASQHVASTPEQSSVFVNDKMTRDNIIVNRNPRNNNYECGVPKIAKARVVGGDEAHIGEWPWTVAIYLHGPKKTEFWCGGSLISEDFVLTAAHCTKDANEKTFDPEQFTVHLGDYEIFSTKDDRVSEPKVFRVRHINPHPDFRRQGYFNDIALIKLSRPATFSEYILPLCLPPEAIERTHVDALVGQTPSVIGYGSTSYDGAQSNVLRDVKLPIWKNADCDKAYFQPITEIFLCAGYMEGGKDACQGDSGGPMQLYYNGRWIQLGIVSFGNRCAEPGYPGVYTRITAFLPWIRDNLR